MVMRLAPALGIVRCQYKRFTGPTATPCECDVDTARTLTRTCIFKGCTGALSFTILYDRLVTKGAQRSVWLTGAIITKSNLLAELAISGNPCMGSER